MRLVPMLFTLLCLSSVAAAQTVTLGKGGKQVTIAIGDDAKLPADFPADVFLPANADLQRVQQVDDDALMLELHAAAAPDSIADQYAAAMVVAGWTGARVAPVPGAIAQAWEKDRRAVLVVAAAEGAGTRLRLQLRARRAALVPPAG